METYKKIENHVYEKSKQGYEGYQDILTDFEKYTQEQLDYIRLEANLKVNAYKRLREFEGIIPLVISIFAVIFSVIPDVLKENSVFFQTILSNTLAVAIICIILYYFLHQISSRAISKAENVLLIINKAEERYMAKNKTSESVTENV